MIHMPKALTYCASLLLICFTQAHGQTPSPCRNHTMYYGIAPQAIEKKIRIVKSSNSANVSIAGKRISSPQGTRWFVEVAPDYSKTEKPWNTRLYIGSDADDKVFLQADFTDHGNTFGAHWINEKLLFVQVWWGRIASSDLILDVDKGKFIYDELANYGQLVEPCQ
jgi:hypothetical protein